MPASASLDRASVRDAVVANLVPNMDEEFLRVRGGRQGPICVVGSGLSFAQVVPGKEYMPAGNWRTYRPR